MGEDSESEIEFEYDYDPTFEMILKDLEGGLDSNEDDDNSSAFSSIPPPPPPMSKQKAKGWFRFPQITKPSQSSRKTETLPPVTVTPSDSANVPTSSIEVQAVVLDEPSNSPLKDSAVASRRRRSLYIVSVSCLACVLLLVLALGFTLRSLPETTNSSGVESSSSFAQAPAESSSTSDETTMATTVSPPVIPTTTTPIPTTPAVELPETTTTAASTTSMEPPNEEEPSCFDVIASDESCYLFQSDINIIFENCDPQPNDWIGIWPIADATDLQNLPEPALWLWTCGSQDCAGEVFVDTLPFGSGLAVGTYVAHLVRLESEVAPYSSSYAISSAFGVSLAC